MNTAPFCISIATTLRHRAKTLLAFAATGLALAAAGPASAKQSTTPPVDKNGKKSCHLEVKETKTKIWIPHDTTITREYADGDTQKEKCVDGSWIMALRPSATTHVAAMGTLATHAAAPATSTLYVRTYDAATATGTYASPTGAGDARRRRPSA